MEAKAYAKVNLSLDVLGKREDCYHDLNSVMVQIELFDSLRFEESDDVILEGGVKDDIILKVVGKVKELFNVKRGVKIFLKKNIPIAAGFGGGSADAAATLIALNELWGLNLGMNELIRIGVEIGSDVPFCLVGGSCFVSGKGEKVENVDMPEMDLLFVNLGYEISTKLAYDELSGVEYDNSSSSLKMKELNDVESVANGLHNDFMHIQKDDVKGLIKKMISLGALNASITGKGPTVFGVFGSAEEAKGAYDTLKDKYKFVYLGRTIK